MAKAKFNIDSTTTTSTANNTFHCQPSSPPRTIGTSPTIYIMTSGKLNFAAFEEVPVAATPNKRPNQVKL